MHLSVLLLEMVERVAVVRMNNPPVNAMGPAFLEDFNRILDDLSATKRARALLLTSACPGFFSAGDDVMSLTEIDDELLSLLPKAHATLNALEALPIPTVAAINGHALGGGLELALTCDFRFMGTEAGRIGLPEVRLGMLPVLGGTQRLPRLIGKPKAIEMMFKGLQITPEEAKQVGLVNDVFPQDTVYEKSLDYARRLSLQATNALAWIKKCVNEGLNEGFARGLAMEQEAFYENIGSPDVKEGIAAFLANRKPVFKG
jgi:enoyl-CoA hydratase